MTSIATADVLQRVPLFAKMKRKELDRLAKEMQDRTFAAGSTAVVEGEGGVGFFIVLDGAATVTVGGREIRKLGVGDWFGEMALLQASGKRTATVTADTDLTCVGMTSWAFKSFLAGHPDAAWQVIETMAQREAATRE
jgi:CRP-like cAMP-binding protein